MLNLNIPDEQSLVSLLCAALVCLMLWLPTVTTRSHYTRVAWHMLFGSLASLGLAAQVNDLAAVALIAMVVATDVGFALVVGYLQLRERRRQERLDALRRAGHTDFEVSRFMDSMFLA